MPTTPEGLERRILLRVLTIDAAAGTSFLGTICGMGGSGDIQIENIPVRLEMSVFDLPRAAQCAELLVNADAAALLVHHMDAPALELLKNAYRILPSDHKLPVALLVVREAGRMEFKMACPTCSQKLWVRDEDQGRVGRCPHCKKTFVLPAQTLLIKQNLMLPASLPVMTVMVGNPGACRGPLLNLAERARLRRQASKSSTAPIQLAQDASATRT